MASKLYCSSASGMHGGPLAGRLTLGGLSSPLADADLDLDLNEASSFFMQLARPALPSLRAPEVTKQALSRPAPGVQAIGAECGAAMTRAEEPEATVIEVRPPGTGPPPCP